MITKDDANNFLNQMLHTEQKMELYYKELTKQLSDDRLIKTLTAMMLEEKDHEMLVKELLKLMENWS